MTFPRNADNSLDFEAFYALNRTQQAAILTELRTENPAEFRQVMDYVRAHKAQTMQNLAQVKEVQVTLDNREKEIDAQINTYTAAYRAEMAQGSSAQNRNPEHNNRNKKNTKCSIS